MSRVKNLAIPALAAALVVGVMAWQGLGTDPVLCDDPGIRLGEIPGYESEAQPPSEAELTTLPKDTRFDKRLYKAADGSWFHVSLVVGGRSKQSIHRPELCLPSQGFQMTKPRRLDAGGRDWRALTLERGAAPRLGFAYTFFNQAGYHTSSHVMRILRDVLDRSFRARIDRWAMITVTASRPDDAVLASFLARGELLVFDIIPGHGEGKKE